MPRAGRAKHSQNNVPRDNLRQFLGNSAFAQSVATKIDAEGYAVLPNVFTPEEADREYDRMWDWVETVSPGTSRQDPTSWRARGSEDAWPCAQRDMMQLHQAGWVFNDMREAMADRIFEQLYGTKELHCSKDGFTLQRPTEQDLARPPNDHYDQGYGLRGLQCIQASVALTDQEHEDGCFLCWPGSHRVHDEMMDWRGPGGARDDFILLKNQERQWLQYQGYEPRRVPVKRGDVILWRSDLAHKGAPPIGRRRNFRAVVYVCMLPAAMTPETVYGDKAAAYRQLQTGCHWPNREEWFRPRHQNAAVQPYFRQLPQLSLKQQQLYGLVRYPAQGPEGSPSDLDRIIMPEANVSDPTCATTDHAEGVHDKKMDHNTKPSLKPTRRWGRGAATALEGAIPR